MQKLKDCEGIVNDFSTEMYVEKINKQNEFY